jgi:uncharacterized protein (TIGR03435 family)
MAMIVAAGISSLGQPVALAQALSFQSISIKPHDPNNRNIGMSADHGRHLLTGVNGLFLLLYAYSVQQFEIVGAPAWIASDRFDIVATAPENATLPQLQSMAQSLLVDRFALKARKETRDLPKYRLVMAKNDVRLAPQLTKDDVDCRTPNRPHPCGMRSSASGVEITGAQMSYFINWLESAVGRRIEDATGLKGGYDFKLDWSRIANRSRLDAIGDALEQQLGLKLEPTHGPETVLVVEFMKQPKFD